MAIAKALTDLIRRRAGNRCEYCHFPNPPFHIEHIVARKHGGSNSDENLALACMRCNAHKGSNLSGIDPETGQTIELFHPRKDIWTAHFRWDGGRLIGITPKGLATISVLEINHVWRVEARMQLIRDNQFPTP